jgi:hypothetical protein
MPCLASAAKVLAKQDLWLAATAGRKQRAGEALIQAAKNFATHIDSYNRHMDEDEVGLLRRLCAQVAYGNQIQLLHLNTLRHVVSVVLSLRCLCVLADPS